MTYYSAIKRNQVLIHATIYMTLKNIVLKWKKADTKTTSCIIPFETFNKGKSIGTVKSLAVAWSWRLEWEVTENSGGNLLE